MLTGWPGCRRWKVSKRSRLRVQGDEMQISKILILLFLVGIVVGGFFLTQKMIEDMQSYRENGGSGALSGNAEYGDMLVDSSIGDASMLNPILAGDSASSDINGLVFNGLVKYDKNIKLVGDLAAGWDVSADGLVITFHLKKNIRWQDGIPLPLPTWNLPSKNSLIPKQKAPIKVRMNLLRNLK